MLNLVVIFLISIRILGFCETLEKINKCSYPIVNIKYTHDPSISLKINFNVKDTINLTCLNLQLDSYKLYLIPNEKFILNDSIKFLTSNNQSMIIIELQFIDLKAIDLTSKVLINLQNKFFKSKISFFYSQFKIITNRSVLCREIDKTDVSFFGSLESIEFAYTVLYFKNTCPFIFSNCKVELIKLNGLSDTYLKRNMLGFLSSNKSINSIIDTVIIDGYRIDLDEIFLDKNVFENVNRLELRGQIKRITIFQMKSLESINLFITNFLEFFFINQNLVKNGDKFKKFNFYLSNYQFPDTDFCFFKNFIHNISYKGVFPINCSCTAIFLFFKIDENTSLSKNYISDICQNLSWKIEECQKKYLNYCILSNISIKSSQIFSNEDFIYNSEMLNFITIIMAPILTLLTIVTNSLNLLILARIENTKKSSSIKLMIINSIINIIYSFIYCIHLINKCVYANGIFCSVIQRKKYVQLFEIIFVHFCLNILKTWSNLTIIGISWLRLGFLSKELWIKKIVDLDKGKKSKVLLTIFLMASIIISIDKLFVVRLNEQFFVLKESDYEEFPNKNTFIIKAFRDIGFHSLSEVYYYEGKAIIFYVFFVFNFFLNDIVLYLFLFIIDVSIIFFLHKTLRNKKILSKKLNKKDEIDLKDTEMRVHWTVGLNLLVFFFLKVFHFGISFYVFIKKLSSNMGYKNVCFNFSRVCSNYLEFSEILSILSYAYTIFLFRNLNKHFKESLQNLYK